MSRIRSNMFNRRTRDREPGTHTHNYNLGLNHGGNYASGEGASIGQHTHRIVASSIPPHSHPIYPNEHGHYSKVMSVEDVWEGGPPLTVNQAVIHHGYDPSLTNGGHGHGGGPRHEGHSPRHGGHPRRRYRRRRKMRERQVGLRSEATGNYGNGSLMRKRRHRRRRKIMHEETDW